MHSLPAKHSSTVALNALWCLLIALTLLAFPVIARQFRLQSGPATPHPTPHTAPQAQAQPQSSGGVLLSLSTPPPGAR